jgi:hypothetical protein
MTMNKILWVSMMMLSAGAALGEDFNGSKPMSCAVLQGRDCLPTEAACNDLRPEAGKDTNLLIDVAKKQVRTPYRYDLLPITTTTNNTKSMILQGTSLEYAWTATIHRTTGRLTIVIADREGAYVIFGQCKLAS